MTRQDARQENRELRDSLNRDSLLVTHVDGMHAHTCAETIIDTVGQLTGVKEVEVDFASGQASIIFDSHKISVHQVLGAIEDAGYRCGEYALGSGGAALE